MLARDVDAREFFWKALCEAEGRLEARNQMRHRSQEGTAVALSVLLDAGSQQLEAGQRTRRKTWWVRRSCAFAPSRIAPAAAGQKTREVAVADTQPALTRRWQHAAAGSASPSKQEWAKEPPASSEQRPTRGWSIPPKPGCSSSCRGSARRKRARTLRPGQRGGMGDVGLQDPDQAAAAQASAGAHHAQPKERHAAPASCPASRRRSPAFFRPCCKLRWPGPSSGSGMISATC